VVVGDGIFDDEPGEVVGLVVGLAVAVGLSVVVAELLDVDRVGPDVGIFAERKLCVVDGTAAAVPVGRGVRVRVARAVVELRLVDGPATGDAAVGAPVAPVDVAPPVAAGSKVPVGTTLNSSGPGGPLTIRIASRVRPEPTITTPSTPATISTYSRCWFPCRYFP
jgi:hypothetical protein